MAVYGTWFALIVSINDYGGEFYPETRQPTYNEFAEKGSYCAFATILLLIITCGSVLLMNLVMKFFGTSRKLEEDE